MSLAVEPSSTPQVATSPRLTDDEVRERAVKIYRYVLRGLRGSDIAKLENLPVRTVNWYIEEGGRLLGGELKLMVKRGLLREFLLHCQERKKELWFNYSAARSIKDRVRCLQQLAEEDCTALDLAERLQFIEQKSLKVDSDAGWVGLLSAALRTRGDAGYLNGQRRTGFAAPISN